MRPKKIHPNRKQALLEWQYALNAGDSEELRRTRAALMVADELTGQVREARGTSNPENQKRGIGSSERSY